MGIYTSYKRRFQLKNANKIRLEKQQKNSETTSTDNENQQRADLISTIQRLLENEVSLATSLISNMRYPKGPNKGNIISPYLQKKAHNYISQNLYKHQSTLQDSNSKLKQENKRLHRKNQALVKRTQSLGAKVQHTLNQKSKHIAEICSLV
ncbi:12873_t:CDS:1 [Ambispora gerdemannii]|uniref:12873_t:CDS:1 n=1 Tax=Ambispora gerdemannii TaxID=144530 RepID=A0A9N9FXJ2_9GLOM|nr:12873_t:CDS:1 [Ambispora gerdemannii]